MNFRGFFTKNHETMLVLIQYFNTSGYAPRDPWIFLGHLGGALGAAGTVDKFTHKSEQNYKLNRP